MVQEVTLPIQWEGWDKQDELVNSYYNAEFIEDFGVFKKGEKFNAITVDYALGCIQFWSDTQIERLQHFKSIPIDDTE